MSLLALKTSYFYQYDSTELLLRINSKNDSFCLVAFLENLNEALQNPRKSLFRNRCNETKRLKEI